MFSLKIIDTDAFLDMPITSRLLYYDLSMRADDDGFVASPRKIQRMIGCSNDDLKLLMAKQFVIEFESGVCVIKHWKIHNYIAKDRYTPTFYKAEMAQLEESDGCYELVNTKCIQNGNKMLPQVRLGLDLDLGLDIDKDKTQNISKPSKTEIVINTYTSNKDLHKAITDFIEMRKKLRKPMTDRALELFLMKLTKLSANDDERIEIINNSTMNCYLGIFPLKKEGANNGFTGKNTTESKGKWAGYKVPKHKSVELTAEQKADIPI